MITQLFISDFLGRFHPVLVHLPIGILLLAVLLYFISVKKKGENLSAGIRYALLIGFMAAVFSSITGYLLSQSGDYEGNTVVQHQWLGITTTVVSGLVYYLYNKNRNSVKWLLVFMAILVVMTGHLGGTLTHGEGYLTKNLFSSKQGSVVSVKPIPDVQEAQVYNDIVQPLLQSKCYNCHAAGKQKGGLRLDEPDFIIKGGKSGKVIVPGSITESEMIQRILLSSDDEDHMPPKEKPQLTKQETELLSWWVSSGADFHKKVSQLNQPGNIKPYLMSLQTGTTVTVDAGDLPANPVEKAPAPVIKKLLDLNVSVSPVAQNSNYLAVSFAAVDTVTNEQLSLLSQLSKQIVSLRMTAVKLNDAAAKIISSFLVLSKLYLNKSNINDKHLQNFRNLTELRYLNLSSTAITITGLANLETLKNLKQLFVFETGINTSEWGILKEKFPRSIIDTGGYRTAFLVSDTIKAKSSKLK